MERFSKTRTESHRRRQVPNLHTRLVNESNAMFQSGHQNFRFNIYPILSSTSAFHVQFQSKTRYVHHSYPSFHSQFPQFSAKNHRKTAENRSVKMARTRVEIHEKHAKIHENKPFLGVNCRENKVLQLEYSLVFNIINICNSLYNSIMTNFLDIISGQQTVDSPFSRHPYLSAYFHISHTTD